jgi:hypothetical protein
LVARDEAGSLLFGGPRRRSAAKMLAKDEERRIAVNVAKLPDLLA